MSGFVVITGFNTDIKHGEKVFHVQTEDRGLANPVVESLVYVGGEILLSKKSPYRDLIKNSQVDEKAVKELMDLQYRRIIEAIRRGRFDGAKPGDTLRSGIVTRSGPDCRADLGRGCRRGRRDVLQQQRPVLAPSGRPRPRRLAATAAPRGPALHLPGRPGSFRTLGSSGPPGPKAPSAAPANRPGTPSSGSMPAFTPERSLDQVIIDYLASEAASEHLELGDGRGELLAGEAVALSIRTSTSLTEKPVAGAHISVRVVSTIGPPQIVFRGVTGSDGLVKATCNIPDIGTGNAALIIAASSALGNNEIKQLIRRKTK